MCNGKVTTPTKIPPLMLIAECQFHTFIFNITGLSYKFFITSCGSQRHINGLMISIGMIVGYIQIETVQEAYI